MSWTINKNQRTGIINILPEEDSDSHIEWPARVCKCNPIVEQVSPFTLVLHNSFDG